ISESSHQSFDKCYINYEISSCTENDADLALFSSEYMIDKLPIFGNINRASIYKSDALRNKPDTLVVSRYVEVSKSNNFKNEHSALSVIENIGDDISKDDYSENKPKDSSLKEIYSEQIFTSFEVLERCLKRYSL
ncbi:24569_t:CDS:1, partial [Cetraspora pellucida]